MTRLRVTDLAIHLNEHGLQCAVVDWWSYACRAYGLEPSHLIAIPNGGARNKITGARLKAEGVRAGFPDLALLTPRGEYHGLFVELKTDKGTAKPSQKEWQQRLLDQGYAAVIARGADVAIRYIEDYLELGKSDAIS